ncbi:MAG: transporter [Naasia sp.]|jgi:RND superfamily putative drug exporter|uniref:MMPL family transporter n=1 Tax=Naasia sp. TaxID=2546198 RepID=UPI0026198491|nr:MMPL family transporter [Naasia sp.]MCU1570954.1 transporter [Naasia sp.]
MATALYRLGLWAYSRPWRVIVAWIVLIVAIGGAAVALGGKTQESYSIPGTESQQAIDKLAAVFPQTAGASVQVVYRAPAGGSVEDDEYRSAIEDMGATLEDVDGVEAVALPYSEYATDAISDDGRVGITSLTLTGSQEEVTDATISDVLATAGPARDAGLEVQFGGQVFQDTSFGITITEAFGVLFAAVVLVIAFGSVLAAGFPLIGALLGVGLTMGAITAVAAFATVGSSAPLLALMIGLAVGIDYSLFIVSRHRNQLATGMDPRESAGSALATAGSAVVFAGATVIIALLGLLVVGIPFLSVMGVGAAFAVLIAVLIAVTLVPALLGLAKLRLAPKEGSRAARRAIAASGDAEDGKPSMGTRWVKLVLKAPIVAVLVVVGLLGALLVPALQLQLSLPDNGSEPRDSTQRKAYDIIADAFGPGRNGPLIVLVDITQTTDVLEDLDAIRAQLKDLPDVRAVGPGTPNPSVDTAILQVIPKSAPDSPTTTALVERIRALAPEIEDRYRTAIAVTGTTAVMIDISSTLGRALVPFAAIVLGLSVLLLMMVFRSLFVPLKAALGFLLSVIGSFGVVVGVFQLGAFSNLLGVEPGPILSFLPILLIAVLFGLAMDYEVFLVSGMRESFVHTGDARRAIVVGFSQAARVVTAAALIMFFVFFAFVPEGAGVIKPIALALAVGVAFDAFLVRMTLVPAAMALAGKAAWYLPRWLGRVLPNVDIEGESLGAHRAGVEWADGRGGAALTLDRAQAARSALPVSLEAPAGATVVFAGEAGGRRALLATLSGRLPLAAGRAQVLGLPLPSDASAVARRVAHVDAAPSSGVSVRDLLAERFALARRGVGSRRREADGLLDRVNRALRDEDLPRISATEDTSALNAEQRVAVALALGVASGAGAIALDLGDLEGRRLECALRIVDAVVPPSVTALLGASRVPQPETRTGRPLVPTDISSKAVLS